MTNFITYKNSTINLDLVKSFSIGTIDYDDRHKFFDSETGSIIEWGLSQRNDNQILFNLGEIKWCFENNEEAKKAFDFLQEAVKAQNLETIIKELTDINLIRADLKARYDRLFPNKDECEK
jgi:hypothetical protein